MKIGLPDWLEMLGTIVAFATAGWTLWKEYRTAALARLMRVTVEVEDCRGGHIVTVIFAGADSYSRYQAQVELLRPKSAALSHGEWHERTGRSFVVGPTFGVGPTIGHKATLHLEENRGRTLDERVGKIVIVGTSGADQRGRLRVTIMNTTSRSKVVSRPFNVALD